MVLPSGSSAVSVARHFVNRASTPAFGDRAPAASLVYNIPSAIRGLSNMPPSSPIYSQSCSTSPSWGRSGNHDGRNTIRPSGSTQRQNANQPKNNRVRVVFKNRSRHHMQWRGKRTGGDVSRGNKKMEKKEKISTFRGDLSSSFSSKLEPKLLTTFDSPTGVPNNHHRSKIGGAENGDSLTSPYRPFVFPGEGYYSRSQSSNYGRSGPGAWEAPLPLLDLSPVLDPRSYCRRSANSSTTASGTSAAMRLLKGRLFAGEIVRNSLVARHERRGSSRSRNAGIAKHPKSDSSKSARNLASASRVISGYRNPNGRRTRAFALTGTGIPSELLQDNIDLADGLLRSKEGAAEISFGNCIDASLTFDNILRVRSRMGENEVHPWPPEFFCRNPNVEPTPYLDGYEHRMQLYLSVMDRLVRAFGSILDPSMAIEPRNSDSDSDALSLANKEYESEKNDAISESTSRSFDLRHWNAAFLRGYAFPPQLVPHVCSPVTPLPHKSSPTSHYRRSSHASPLIVELSQGESLAWPTYVRMSLQGTPTPHTFSTANATVVRRRRFSPVTLVFDAKFSRGIEGS